MARNETSTQLNLDEQSMTHPRVTDARFALGEISEDGMVTLITYRQNIPPEVRAQLTEQFIVEWTFPGPCPGGLPDPTQLEPAVQLQELVTPVLEAGGDAVLAVMSTGNGYREIYFYCRDPRRLQARFNECLQGRELPIELHAGHDPSWRVFEEFVAPLKGGPTTG